VKTLGWKIAGIAALALASAAVFAAYLHPNMLAVFADVWAFCVGLVK
jgi:hypothetical protein